MDGIMVATMISRVSLCSYGRFCNTRVLLIHQFISRRKRIPKQGICTTYVHITESDEHPSWSLDESWEEGFEFADTIERTALAALTELCKRNKIEIGTSPARYFPIRNQEDGTWKHRVKALKNKSRVESDVIAAASTDYMTHMYNLYRECQAEYGRQR